MVTILDCLESKLMMDCTWQTEDYSLEMWGCNWARLDYNWARLGCNQEKLGCRLAR